MTIVNSQFRKSHTNGQSVSMTLETLMSFISLLLIQFAIDYFDMGVGGGPVGRVFASNTRGPLLASSHQQILNTFKCIKKPQIKEKRQGMS